MRCFFWAREWFREAEWTTRGGGPLRVVHSGLMAAALPPMMSKDDIICAHAKLEQLRVDMAKRSAGGREASGRYKKHDTARKVYIETVAMPSLRLGKRCREDDWRRLFLPGDDEIAGADKADMDRWYKKHKHDPRSTSAESYQLDEGKQITLLSWVQRNPSAYVRPQSAPSGAPRAYRLTSRDCPEYDRALLYVSSLTTASSAHNSSRTRSAPCLGGFPSDFAMHPALIRPFNEPRAPSSHCRVHERNLDADCTISISHACRKKLVPTARVPAGATLVWLASATYRLYSM